MTTTGWALLAALAAFLVADIGWRRIPNELALAAVGVAVVARGPQDWQLWAGLGVGLALAALAGFPGGDIKAAAALGSLVGPVAISACLAVAFLLTLAAWRWGLTRVPWMVYVAGGMAGAIVAGTLAGGY